MARKFLGGKPTVGSTDVPVVLESRTITATAPVTIAGTTSADLSADRTIAVTAATTSAAGVVQLSDSTSTNASTKAATEKAVYDTKLVADGAVPKSLVDAKGDLLVGSADNTVARLAVGATDGHVLTVDAAATNGIKWAASSGGSGGSTYVAQFSKSGTIATGTGTFRWYNDSGATRTIGAVRASVGTAPTGASLIVDVNVSVGGAAPTSIFTASGDRPTITASSFTDLAGAKTITSIANTDYFTVDIDQVGSTIAGSDLTVVIWLT